jgi:predicted ATP-grasp superfamily ATP-dependent carboligase
VVKGFKESGHITYVNSREELEKIDTREAIIQEYIQGEGYGFFALLDYGKPKAIFMHKRRREYPITGGASTSAESIYDEKLKETGLKLLKALNWHGVAMVEFKKDEKAGDFVLMEINPKFWGSLDLAIASDMDFPYLAVKMALGEDFEPVMKYKVGVKFRWPWPDDTVRFFAKPSDWSPVADMFNPKVKTNVWFTDFRPNWQQLKQTCYVLCSHMKKKDLKYPHGKPIIK